MWMLSFLPNIVVHLMMTLGILGVAASLIFRFVPFVSKYFVVMLILSLSVSIFAAWLEGGLAKTAEYQAAVHAMELRIKQAEQQAAEANAQIEYVFIDKIQRVRDVQVVVQEKIRDVAIKVDQDCRITADVIDIHNAAARINR